MFDEQNFVNFRDKKTDARSVMSVEGMKGIEEVEGFPDIVEKKRGLLKR